MAPQVLVEARASLAARVVDSRRRTDEIFEHLRSDALYDRPIPERHRLIFYLGHVEAFDYNIVAKSGFGLKPFKQVFDDLFAFGIDPIDGGLPNEPASEWPSVGEVMAYRDRVRATVDRILDDDWKDEAFGTTVMNVSIEHRLEHAETLAYLIHQLPTSRLEAPVQKDVADPGAKPGTVAIPPGTATLGLKRGASFGWCNEFEEHTVEVGAFEVDRLPITNGQFLEFLRNRGYDQRELWSPDDWAWKERAGLRHPGFWHLREDGWYLRGVFTERVLPLAWPAYVSFAEANAYARWKKKRLMTEAEFHRAAYDAPGGERAYPWGSDTPRGEHGNFDFHRWDPDPVGAHPAGRSAHGAEELVGNGWEWTSSPHMPFEGFEAYPFYPGYSANFFDGKHFIMKGGSPRTAACMLRRSFRNWFQGHYPYMYAKFRLASS